MTGLAPSRFILALRNVFRHRSRTAANLLAISLGIVSMILAGGFVNDVLFQLGEATIHSQTGHIQLARQTYWSSQSNTSQDHMIDNPKIIIKALESETRIEHIVNRINFAGMLNNGKRDLGIIGEGIEPDNERKIGSFMRYTEGRALTDSDTDSMVIGQGVAQALNLHIGERVTLVISLPEGAVNTMDFQVAGIFQSFSKEFDARAIRIHLNATRELLNTKSAHVLVISLKETHETDNVARKLSAFVVKQDLQALTWRELSDFYEKTVQLYKAQFGVLRLIIFLMVVLSVTNSINMSLYERTREFGTLLALGEKPKAIFSLIMMESVVLALLGTAIGMTFSYAIAEIVSAIGIPMPAPPNSNLGYTAQIRLEPLSALSSCAIGFGAAIFATLYPAYRAAKINIVDALRHAS